jgi:hypothetical protein
MKRDAQTTDAVTRIHRTRRAVIGCALNASIDRDPCAGEAQPHESEDLARDDILS